MVRFLALAVTVAMAAALLWAGLEKARSFTSFASLLEQLGFARSWARPSAVVVIALELSVALSLTYGPSLATLAGVIGLAAAFAFSGLLAVHRNKQIRCGCFGPYGGSQLGKHQMVALPFWLSGVALLWLDGSTVSPGAQATVLPAAVALTIATIRGVSAVRAAYEARGDRRSAREMFAWLNR
jgi:hypothetical protein